MNDEDQGPELWAAFNKDGELDTVENVAKDLSLAEIGDQVHYVSFGSAPQNGEQKYPPRCRAATVTEVSYFDIGLTKPSGNVGLCVINPTGLFFHSLDTGGSDYVKPEQGVQPEGGSWHRRGECA